MLYQFLGSGRLATQGVLAKGVLLIASPVTAGTKLVLRWAGVDHTLVFVANPQAANEFSIGDGSRAYMRSLLAQLKTYFPLREDFILTENDVSQLPGIVWTARQPGPLYDIVATLPVGTPFGFGTTIAGADPLVRPQYSVYAEIWLQKVGSPGLDPDTDFERIFTPTINCDEEGNAEFDVGKVLHARMQADFPNWSLSAPEIAQYSARKYFVTFGEAYGFPLQVGKVLSDQVRNAIWGGTDYLSQIDGGRPLLSVHIPGKALRFGDLTRFVRPDEPQFLSFLNSGADQPGSLLRIIRIFDNDATDDDAGNLAAQNVLTGQKITYSVGPAQLNLLTGLPAGRTLKEYTVQRFASNGITALSEVYRYVLNYDFQPYTRYFAYVNSLGCLDTLATFGKGSRELARFTEQAERYLAANYEVQDGQFADYNVGVQQQFEVTTGFRSEAELEGWTDFYRSAQRFRLTPGNGTPARALPIGITSKSIKQAKDGDTQFAHSFAFSYLFRNDFYSEELTDLPALPPPNFVPGGGTVVVQPVQTVVAADPTIPDVVRSLTTGLINNFKQAYAWGNHRLAGYLDQTAASALFRRADQKVSFINDLVDKPTTRDQAGLLDVPTRNDLFKIITVKPHLSSWSGDIEPEDIDENQI